ncbi:MAG: glycosyltransferase [Actinobacteria bacterium]|nr:glycosyltransferase [Actinomycetota bacterium]
MSSFLLTAMPFTGHVAPMTAIAGELVRRGHDVRFYTGSRFRARVEAVGARLVPWRQAPDFDETDLAATFPRLIGKKGVRQLLVNMVDCFIRTAPAQVADLVTEWHRDPWDALAADETSVGAVLFSETMHHPWSTVAVLPLNLLGPAGPPSGMGLRPGNTAVTRVRDAVLRGLVPALSRPLVRALDEAEHAVGLEARGWSLDRLVFSPTLILASGAPALDYDRADRPEHVHFVGELATRTRATPAVPLPSWWADLDGRRVVLVTQGTLNTDPEDLVRPALQALDGRDMIVVATTGVPGRDGLSFPVPANTRVIGIAPFADLLPRLDLAITNGGWGGTLATLAQGIPLVIAGGDLDKPEVAARVAFTGAGVNLRTGTPSAGAVGAAVDRVLGEGGFRDSATRVGSELRALGGAAHAADLLERTARASVSPS